MSITKTLAAAALAISLTTSGAQAGTSVQTDHTPGLLIGAAILGLVAFFLITNGGEDEIVSTKDVNGTDGKPIPGSPSVSNTRTVMDF